MRRLLALLCAWLCLLCSSGCSTPRPAPVWVSGDVAAASERVAWEATRLALEKNNFPVGAGLDPAHMLAVSGWRQSLAPFRGKGFRERCHIRYERKSAGVYTVNLRVERERNDDIVKPLDLTYAEWKSEPDNPERARIVLQYIRSLLTPP